MKKSILTKCLPFVAAVLLAASCGKDINDDGIVAQPSSAEESAQSVQSLDASNTVAIPFSVRVSGGASLSKIQYTERDGDIDKVVDREFTPSDCGNIQLSVSGDGATALLDLKSKEVDGKTIYYFGGTVNVEPGKEDAFKNGEIDLIGTFTTNGESTTCYSTTSLLDLERKCKHEYKAEFKSNDESITLVDQNAYLSFTVYEKQTKFDLTFNDETTACTFEPNSDHKIWIAVPCGGSNNLPTVKGTMINVGGKDLTPGTVYNVDRTKEVDLGPGWNILWKTTNETGGDVSSSYNNDDVATSPYKAEKYYKWGNACAFGRMNGNTYVEGSAAPFRLPTKAEYEALVALKQSGLTTHNDMACKEFKNDYGSVFFPAAAGSGGFFAGSRGCYWSGTEYEKNADYAFFLYFNDGDAKVDYDGVHDECSVRLVRGL